MRIWVAWVVLGACVAFGQPLTIRGGDPAPRGLRLKGCSLSKEDVKAGRVLEVAVDGRGPLVVWAGLTGTGTKEPHLVFAWFPKGRPAKARCVDAGIIDRVTVELSSLPLLPVVRSVQTTHPDCFTSTRTMVLAWTNAAHDFELVSNRTWSSSDGSCAEEVFADIVEDSRFARATKLITDRSFQQAEQMLLGLVGERPSDANARELLSRTWKNLNAPGRR